METKTRMLSVESTVFFKSDGKVLRQLVRVNLENNAEERDGLIVVRYGLLEERFPLGKVPLGPSNFDIYLKDIEQPIKVTFAFWSGEERLDDKTIDWQPQKKWDVHLVHYSHHDLGYTDIPSNTIREHIGFLDDVLKFCEETENWPEASRFRWLVEQGYSLVEYAENRPEETVERLMHFVRNGQVEVTALFGNQTMEMSSHEELVRLLYPTFEFKRKYGIEILTAAHNDIPGFSWGLASVLAAAGVKYFSPGVPSWYYGSDENRVHPLWDEDRVLSMKNPGGFWWEGPDGAKVLLWYNLHGKEWYPTSYHHALRELPERLAGLDADAYPYNQVLYTIRGGHRDNAPATNRTAYLAREWNENWAYPRLVSSTYKMFLTKLEEKFGGQLKILRGDVPGTDYSTAATCTPKETSVNRGAHEYLMAGEKLATLASLLSDYSYPRDTLNQAYRNVFYYDEHCWGMHQSGGPAMDGDWSEKSTFAYRAAALAHDVLQKSSNRIVDEIDYPEDGYYLTVFNPLSWERTDIVRAAARPWIGCGNPMHWIASSQADEGAVMVSASAIGRSVINPPQSLLEQPFELVDMATGAKVAYQLSCLVDPQAAQPFAAERFGIGKFDPAELTEIVFLAEGLPAIGYKTYRLVPCARWPKFAKTGNATRLQIENSFYQMQIDRRSGTLTSLYDKQLGRELVDTSADHPFAQMVVRSSESGQEQLVAIQDVAISENGPVFTTLKRKGVVLGCPQWTQEITLYHGLKRVDVNTRVLRDSTPMLEVYFAFPFQVDKPNFRFEATNAVIEPLRDQLPGTNTDYYAVQHWADVFEQDPETPSKDWGVVWSPVDTHMTEFGGLWPGYVSGAHHGVAPPGYGHPFLKTGEMIKGHIYALAMYNNFRTNFINVHPGESLLRYSFSSHNGDWQSASPWRFGWNALQPPVPVWMKGPKQGRLKQNASFLQLDAPNIILVTLKKAEDENGYICRFVEVQGKQTNLKLTAPAFSILHAFETTPIEENQRMLPCTEHEVFAIIKPFAIKTIRVILKE
jgi:hypothetical protein